MMRWPLAAPRRARGGSVGVSGHCADTTMARAGNAAQLSHIGRCWRQGELWPRRLRCLVVRARTPGHAGHRWAVGPLLQVHAQAQAENWAGAAQAMNARQAASALRRLIRACGATGPEALAMTQGGRLQAAEAGTGGACAGTRAGPPGRRWRWLAVPPLSDATSPRRHATGSSSAMQLEPTSDARRALDAAIDLVPSGWRDFIAATLIQRGTGARASGRRPSPASRRCGVQARWSAARRPAPWRKPRRARPRNRPPAHPRR